MAYLVPLLREPLRGQRGHVDVSGHKPKGHERAGPGVLQPARVYAALGGVSLWLMVALGRLPLQLHKFRVDGAQTPLTGYLLPPPYHARALEATGGVFQLGEPSMDGVRHCRTSLASRMVGYGLTV